jgi:diguanylate cyclase (GGDEF)-like protein
MNWELTTPALILFFSADIAVFVAAMVWKRRAIPGGMVLFWLMVAVAEWSLASALEAASVTLSAKIFWSKVEYLGSACSPTIFLIFSLEYSQNKKWLTRRNLLLFWGLPIFFILLTATNEWHHLIWTGFTPSPVPASNLYIYHHGPGYWLYIGYVYLFVLIATLLLVQAYMRFPRIFRQQIGAMLIGAAFPWISSAMYAFDLNPLPGLELIPISFSFTGVALSWGISHLKLFDLMPIARDALIENLRGGVLVLDTQNRIVDMNPAARHLFDMANPEMGGEVRGVFGKWPALVDILEQKPGHLIEVHLSKQPPRFLDVQVVPIPDRRGRRAGYLATIHDITDRKQAEIALETKSHQLEQLVITDDLTSLYNRRHINDVLKAEYERSARYNSPLSIAYFDIDDFKLINDRHGHACGDEVLKIIARELRRSIRAVDVPARMGGDEFLVVFPHTQPDQVWNVLERLRLSLGKRSIGNAGIPIHISGGITAWYPEDSPDQVLNRVDRLLYEAKQKGKNHFLIDPDRINSAES